VTQASSTASLIRLSVTAGSRRVDLGLPGGIPVAELVPELARELGQLDPTTASQGFRLVRHDGIPVEPDRSLAAQGIEDGFLLSLEAAGDPVELKVYDDVVEAVADLVESSFAPWTADNSSRTALGAAVVLFGAGAVALFTARTHGALVVGMAAAVALLLVVAAAVLSHARRQPASGAALALVASGYAAVAGFAVTSDGSVWGEPLLYAGAAMAVVGAIGAAVVQDHRVIVAVSSVVGAVLTVAGALVAFAGFPGGGVAAVVFAMAVIVGNLFPWFAVSSSRLSANPPRTEAEIFSDAPAVDSRAVRRQVLAGHDLMLALSIAAGATALLAAPFTAAAGKLGTLLGVVGFVAVLLRTRHGRTRATVLVAMVVGIVGLAVIGVSAALTHPTWRPLMGVALAAAAAVVVALALIAPKSRVRLGRVADAVDGLCLVALLPLAAAAAHVF
jgi:type VII secretion integral membrane protein EccD